MKDSVNRMLTKISLCVALLFCGSVVAGELTLRELEKDGASCPWLDGEVCVSGASQGRIDAGDAEKFISTVEKWKSTFKAAADTNIRLGFIQLSSPGGDIYEAMKIGEWLRKNKVQVVNPMDSPCYSACILMLAGGVMRIGSNVGLHAFYSSETKNPNFDYDVESISMTR